MKKNLYTPDYIPDNVCKYDVYAMLSFGGVCGITDSQTDRQRYAIPEII